MGIFYAYCFLGDKRSIGKQQKILNLIMDTAVGQIKNKRAFVAVFLLLLVCGACKQQFSAKNKIRGKWLSEDGKTGLTITQKEFTLNEGEPIAESYFVKDDSIFTSYEGSRPCTKFVIKNLSDKSFTLVYPDSTLVNFVR